MLQVEWVYCVQNGYPPDLRFINQPICFKSSYTVYEEMKEWNSNPRYMKPQEACFQLDAVKGFSSLSKGPSSYQRSILHWDPLQIKSKRTPAGADLHRLSSHVSRVFISHSSPPSSLQIAAGEISLLPGQPGYIASCPQISAQLSSWIFFVT